MFSIKNLEKKKEVENKEAEKKNSLKDNAALQSTACLIVSSSIANNGAQQING